MNVSAKIRYRNELYIKDVFCRGCFFDELYYILNTEELIEHEAFEKHFMELRGYYKDLISGALVIVCHDILTLVLKDEVQLMKLNCYSSHGFCTTSIFKTSELLYKFKLRTSNTLFVRVYLNQN